MNNVLSNRMAVSLFCPVYRPTPTVTWSRHGDRIRTHVRQESYGKALVFDALDFSDAGIYECEADSDGKASFKNVTLMVKCKYLPFSQNYMELFATKISIHLLVLNKTNSYYQSYHKTYHTHPD